jgi:GTPase SAR1 family protein
MNYQQFRWSREGSIITKKPIKKLVFMSLAMTGKTTICKRILDENWIPSKDDRYYAIIDYERYEKKILGTEFTLFNLGGQTAFLDRFTGELAEFIFGGTIAYIYIIDSVDIKSISLAKYYLDLSLKLLNQYSPKSSVFLFIHKQDLLPKSMKDEVNQTIEEYMLKDVNRIVRVFHTTVYNNSIFQAMDTVFREHIQIYEEDLLFVDTIKEVNDEDDSMLSLSLREALKILRGEDEDEL